MFVAERFLLAIVKDYGKRPRINRWRHFVSAGLKILESGVPYPFLSWKKHEWTVQYIKEMTESFDDYFPCRVKNRKLKHVLN